MSVKVSVSEGRVSVSSPYNPAFVSGAKSLGGRWNPAEKAWTFRLEAEASVRALCMEAYSTDGEAEAEQVVALVRLGVAGKKALPSVRDCTGGHTAQSLSLGCNAGDELRVGGQLVAESRWGEVVYGDGCRLVRGSVESTGQRKRGCKGRLNVSRDAVVRLSLPRAAFERLVEEYGAEVVSEPASAHGETLEELLGAA